MAALNKIQYAPRDSATLEADRTRQAVADSALTADKLTKSTSHKFSGLVAGTKVAGAMRTRGTNV